MEIKKYIEDAMRTAKPFPTYDQDMDHAVIGMITELGELATSVKRAVIYEKGMTDDLVKNIREEAGDLLWYWALAVFTTDADIESGFNSYPAVADKPKTLSMIRMFIDDDEQLIATEPVEVIKALNVTVSEISREVGPPPILLGSMAVLLILLLSPLGINIDDVAAENIAKLRERFPASFSNEAAEARADKGGLDALHS